MGEDRAGRAACPARHSGRSVPPARHFDRSVFSNRHFDRAQPPSRHFDRAQRAEKSGRRRAPGGCRSLRRRRSARRVSPLRPGPRAGPPVEMTGEGTAVAPCRFERSATPSRHFDRAQPPSRHFDRAQPPSRHFDRAQRAKKSGRRRAPGGCRSLWRRRCADRISPLRLRSGQAAPPRPKGRGSGRNDGRGRPRRRPFPPYPHFAKES